MYDTNSEVLGNWFRYFNSVRIAWMEPFMILSMMRKS
jgi:hypothetical protein